MPFPGSFRLGRNLVFSAQVSFLFRILRVRGCIRGRALFFEALSGRVGAVGRLHPYSISIGIVGGRAGRLRPCSLVIVLGGIAPDLLRDGGAPPQDHGPGEGGRHPFLFILVSFLFDFLMPSPPSFRLGRNPILPPQVSFGVRPDGDVTRAQVVFFCKIFGWPAGFP